jgi:drug/metabolite transporter (DMT)-like permease
MKNRDPFFFFLLFLTALFWGGSFVFTKYLLESQTPTFIIFFRLVIASVIMVTICLIFFRKELRIKKENIFKLLILSFFEPFLYFIFETYSLQKSDASVVSIIIATIPLFTALISKYYFKEVFTKLNFFGVIISFVGIIVMLFPSISELSGNMSGVVLAFCAVMTSIAYSVTLKKLPETIHPVAVITYQNIIGLILFLPLFLILNSKSDISTGIASIGNPQNLIFLIILAFFCSSLAFIFYIKGLRHLGLGKANTFTNLIPVITAILSFFILNESFPVNKIFGIVIVVAGLFLVQKKKITS